MKFDIILILFELAAYKMYLVNHSIVNEVEVKVITWTLI